MAENEILTKMEQSKELDVSSTKTEVPIRVMGKDPKNVEVGKKLVQFNRRKKESRPGRLKQRRMKLN